MQHYDPLEHLDALLGLLDHYRGRIEARVGEDSGDLFDVCLSVGALDIAAIRLRSPSVIQLFRDTRPEPLAMAPDGSLVPLPD